MYKQLAALVFLASFGSLAHFSFSEGREEAAQACQELTFVSDQNACMKIVKDAKTFSQNAVTLCTKMTFSSNAVDCFKAIKDKTYLDTEVEQCEIESTDWSRTSCLNRAGKKASRSHRPQWRSSFDARNEAAEVCKDLDFVSHRNQCANIVRDADYFTPGAISICQQMSFSSNAVTCFETIKNKDYLAAELTRCQKSSFDSSRVNCLKTAGKLKTVHGKREL
jgi:hypothetical protein